MPRAVFYSAFGLNGYRLLEHELREGRLYLHAVRCLNRCSHCWSWRVIQKGTKTRVLRTVPIGEKPVLVVVQMRRFWCRDCRRTRYERLGIADPKKHYTHVMEHLVMALCMRMTVQDVAKFTGLHWATVKAIDRKRLRRSLPGPGELRKLRYLGVDEVSVRRGHSYLTIVVNLEEGRVVWIGEGRRVDSLEPFIKRLKRLGVALRAVAMDMWAPFAKAVRRHYRRMRLVYDVFHILADYSRVLTEIRVDEYKKLRGKTSALIKGAHYLLLRAEETLSATARERLETLLRINQPISTAYVLKEDLRLLWSQPSLEHAWAFLAEWVAKALSSGIVPLRRFARKLRRHAEGILNYYLTPISNARTEGINNQIKVIKRKAFGYRDVEYFKLKIYNLHTLRYSLV